MCGIAGIWGRSRRGPFPLSSLGHRGPDGRSEWADPANNVWLGHTRLSILDLTDAGRQPMTSLEGRYRIVYNGEIYNFIELRKELQDKGYSFQSDTDTEVILAAYDFWGTECLHRLNGMWAFAIWDAHKKELWLARDRFGKKPLYYYHKDDCLAFASEVQALHRWLGVDAPLDDAVVRDICGGRFGWQGTPHSYLADVHALPAGFCLHKRAGAVRLQRWYRLAPGRVRVPKGLPAQSEVFRDLFEDACRIRLRSDVAIATCLSGGLDSASITAMVHRGLKTLGARAAKDFHRAFCAAFPGTMLDEAVRARELADSVGAELITKEIVPPSPERLLEAIRACDGPMHALAFFPIWELYGQIAANGVKVTLDGQGPDEMLGGYLENVSPALHTALRSGRLFWLWDVYKAYAAQGEIAYRSSSRQAKAEAVALLRSPLSKLKRWAAEWCSGQVQENTPTLESSQPVPGAVSPLVKGLYTQFCQTTLPTILQQYDRCSMAHGVECRMPFLDHRLVEFCFSLPEKSIVSGGYTKRVLREAMKGLVPDSTRLNRTKIGFNAPIVEWFLGPLKAVMLDTIRSKGFAECAYFDGPKLSDRFEAWLRNPTWDGAWAFWPPVHYVLWRREVVNSRFSGNGPHGRG